MEKKGQINAGMVVGLVFGIAFLIIGTIIAFTVVGILDGSNLIPQKTYYVINESQFTTAGGVMVYANTTGYTLNGSRQSGASSYVIDAVWVDYNQSNGSAISIGGTPAGYNVSLAASNYSLYANSSSNLSSARPLTYQGFPNASVSYHYTGDGNENIVAKNMTSNFSSGVQKIATKLPTVLLIAAVILILSILAVLIVVWQRIRGGSGNL